MYMYYSYHINCFLHYIIASSRTDDLDDTNFHDGDDFDISISGDNSSSDTSTYDPDTITSDTSYINISDINISDSDISDAVHVHYHIVHVEGKVYMIMLMVVVVLVVCLVIVGLFAAALYPQCSPDNNWSALNEEEKVALMKQSGYINPTYKFFDQVTAEK